MKSVGAFAAKTHFSQLLIEVEHGEKVAMLVPIEKTSQPNVVLEAMKTIRLLRKKTKLGKGLTIKFMREEGRK